MKKKLSHIDSKGLPSMVDVSTKEPTYRVARARAVVIPGKEILSMISDNELKSRKGPVFQTAIIAGVMAAKRTSELIPLCHPVGLDDCQVNISVEKDKIIIDAKATVVARTGVEMEVMIAASVAALTIYDMCKGVSHDIVISEVKLMEKTGGKNKYKRI